MQEPTEFVTAPDMAEAASGKDAAPVEATPPSSQDAEPVANVGEGTPEQTDNTERTEDGPQDVSQEPSSEQTQEG